MMTTTVKEIVEACAAVDIQFSLKPATLQELKNILNEVSANPGKTVTTAFDLQQTTENWIVFHKIQK